MANGHGGSRTPSNPAPVSGPSQLSRRTDGGPGQPARYVSGLGYGQGQELMDSQTAAPMSASGASQTQGQMNPAPNPAAPPVPLGAPTQRPDEPVTEGNPLGPGAGPGVLSGGVGTNMDAAAQDARQLKAYLPALEKTANMPNVPESFVRFVHYLRGV